MRRSLLDICGTSKLKVLYLLIGVAIFNIFLLTKLIWSPSSESTNTASAYADFRNFLKTKPFAFLAKTSCNDLLSENGTWHNHVWRPTGCSLHRYTVNETKKCMKIRKNKLGFSHLVFVGDSRVRDTFQQMATIFLPNLSRSIYHEDKRYSFPKYNLTIDFRWMPFIDSAYNKLLGSWAKQSVSQRGRPDLVVNSLAAWMMREWSGKDDTTLLNLYRVAFDTELTGPLREIVKDGHTKVLWKFQDPVTSRPGKPRRLSIYYAWNRLTSELLENHPQVIKWWSSVYVSDHYRVFPNSSTDGLHFEFPGDTQSLNIQILLNYYCNRHMKLSDSRICCSS